MRLACRVKIAEAILNVEENEKGGSLMNSTKIAEVIVLVAIVVTVLWGFLGGWDRSWIAMLVGVMVACIVRVIGKKE